MLGKQGPGAASELAVKIQLPAWCSQAQCRWPTIYMSVVPRAHSSLLLLSEGK